MHAIQNSSIKQQYRHKSNCNALSPVNSFQLVDDGGHISTHTDAVDGKQADVYQCLISHLKTIYHKWQNFMTLVTDVFGVEQITHRILHISCLLQWKLTTKI